MKSTYYYIKKLDQVALMFVFLTFILPSNHIVASGTRVEANNPIEVVFLRSPYNKVKENIFGELTCDLLNIKKKSSTSNNDSNYDYSEIYKKHDLQKEHSPEFPSFISPDENIKINFSSKFKKEDLNSDKISIIIVSVQAHKTSSKKIPIVSFSLGNIINYCFPYEDGKELFDKNKQKVLLVLVTNTKNYEATKIALKKKALLYSADKIMLSSKNTHNSKKNNFFKKSSNKDTQGNANILEESASRKKNWIDYFTSVPQDVNKGLTEHIFKHLLSNTITKTFPDGNSTKFIVSRPTYTRLKTIPKTLVDLTTIDEDKVLICEEKELTSKLKAWINNTQKKVTPETEDNTEENKKITDNTTTNTSDAGLFAMITAAALAFKALFSSVNKSNKNDSDNETSEEDENSEKATQI